MNKKEKGYTLIELLAVLAIMAAILLIAVPSITKQLSTVEESNYEQFKQNVYLAAQTHINAYPNDYEALKKEGGSVCIDVGDLVSKGWLKSTLKNPKTEKKISLSSSVKVVNTNGEYQYSYNPNSQC